jgi:hypothetical protein
MRRRRIKLDYVVTANQLADLQKLWGKFAFRICAAGLVSSLWLITFRARGRTVDYHPYTITAHLFSFCFTFLD